MSMGMSRHHNTTELLLVLSSRYDGIAVEATFESLNSSMILIIRTKVLP